MTPMERMISMSRGARIGRSLVEDSPLEAPVGGHNRHTSLMNPATREMVLKSRAQDIEKFAESRQLNAGAIMGVAEAAMRLGRVPDLRQYGFTGDDAKAIKHFVAGDVLNIAIEQLDAMDTIHEAMTDRDAANNVRALARAGAEILLQKHEQNVAGYDKALKALAAGDLLTVRNLLGENLTALGAAKALVGAMNAAPDDVKEQVKAEATQIANIGSYMNLGTAMTMQRPRTLVNADKAERIEQERTALKIAPRLGASPFERDVLTLDRMAELARQAGETEVHENNFADEERDIYEQCDLDEAQVRLVKQGSGHFHAVHRKTGKKIGDVRKSGKQWHAKGHSPGPSGRTHSYGDKFKRPKSAGRYLSGGYDEQESPGADIESPTPVAPKGEKVKKVSAKKLRSAGEYEPGQFHPGSHGTAESVMVFGEKIDLNEGSRGIGKLERLARKSLADAEAAQTAAVRAKGDDRTKKIADWEAARKKANSIYVSYQHKGESRAARKEAGIASGKYRNLPPGKKMVFGTVRNVGKKS